MDKILVSNIQRFSLYDGPGIRTTVFLKGCSVHCPWCCNPENISPHIQKYVDSGIHKEWGKWYSSEELLGEILKDRSFYSGDIQQEDFHIENEGDISHLPGGVTFSGGEALLQSHALSFVFRKLREHQIHIAVETSLFVPSNYLKEVLDLIDFYYVDLKIIDVKRCHRLLGGNVDWYTTNFENLMESSRPVVVRIPVIAGYTDDEDNICELSSFLSEVHKKRNNILRIELLKGHHLGDSKYEKLGQVKPVFQLIDDKEMKWIKEVIEQSGFKAIINKM